MVEEKIAFGKVLAEGLGELVEVEMFQDQIKRKADAVGRRVGKKPPTHQRQVGKKPNK